MCSGATEASGIFEAASLSHEQPMTPELASWRGVLAAAIHRRFMWPDLPCQSAAAGRRRRSPSHFVVRYWQRARIVMRVLAIQLALSCVLRQVLVMTFGDATVHGAIRAGVFLAGTAIDLLAGRQRRCRGCWCFPCFVCGGCSGRGHSTRLSPWRGQGSPSSRASSTSSSRNTAHGTTISPSTTSCIPMRCSATSSRATTCRCLSGSPSWPEWPSPWSPHRGRAPSSNDWPWRDRLKGLALTGGLALIAGGGWLFVPDHVVGGRVANELAINGWAQLVRAYLTAHLDYEAYYATLPADDAAAHLRQLLSQSDGSGGLLRHFEPRRHGTDDPMGMRCRCSRICCFTMSAPVVASRRARRYLRKSGHQHCGDCDYGVRSCTTDARRRSKMRSVVIEARRNWPSVVSPALAGREGASLVLSALPLTPAHPLEAGRARGCRLRLRS